jgi:CMP-N,N'-diacetyllegionaminic acid synthase
MSGLIIAIQTARAGSKSVPGKNEMSVNDEPLYVTNLRAACRSKKIDHVCLSSDISSAPYFCKLLNCTFLKRSDELAQDHSSHYETIASALYETEQMLNAKAEIIVVLLGNNRCAFENDLDNAITMLESTPQYSSVISAAKYNMFNPLRSYRVTSNRTLEPFFRNPELVETEKDFNDKDALGEIFFFNGSFWVMRRDVFLENNGPCPFPWLGNNIAYIEQDPRCMEIDASWQIQIVKEYGI